MIPPISTSSTLGRAENWPITAACSPPDSTSMTQGKSQLSTLMASSVP